MTGIDRATASAYLAWIETVFLIHRVPAWTRSPSGKIIRRSKLFMVDSAVAAGLVGATAGTLSRADDPRTGPLLESPPTGRVVCIEVKATTTVRAEDARWLHRMHTRLAATGTSFTAGVVLHTGTHRLRLADDVVAVPIADLWT